MATIEQARARMSEAGYSAEAIEAGAAYAEEQGYSGAEEFFSLAMARILYSAADLADGARYPVAPGSLDDAAPDTHDDGEIEVRADFAQAASLIQWRNIGADDGWKATPYQVADAAHDPARALRIVSDWLDAQS